MASAGAERSQRCGTGGGIVASILGGAAAAMRRGAALVQDFNGKLRDELEHYAERLKDPQSSESLARGRYEAALGYQD